MQPLITREIPVASVKLGTKIYVQPRWYSPRRVCEVIRISAHPRKHRQTLFELKVPNGTKLFSLYFNEADYVVEVLDQ